MRYVLPLVVFIALSLLAGALGSLATLDAIPTWYAGLTKPVWTPPNWVFAPVWNTLYVLMGSAMALVWVRGGPGRWIVAWVFIAHLVVNTLWSVVFFGLKEVGLALAIITLLFVLILVLIKLFGRYSRTAAWLMVPYLLWVGYATTLNLGILVLN